MTAASPETPTPPNTPNTPNTLDTPAVQALTEALVRVRRGAAALPVADWLGRLEHAAQAYRVQAGVAQAMGWFAPDAVPAHWKSGGPSREAVLTHAPLPPAGVSHWQPGQPPVDFSAVALRRRGVEAEVALRLGRDVTAEEAAHWARAGDAMPPAGTLVDAMAVSVEVVDTRWQHPLPAGLPAPAMGLLNTADQQVHGALVLGAWQPYEARDWLRQRGTLTFSPADGGAPRELAFEGTHALGDPAWLLRTWLAHATREGHTARAGTVVTTGTWSGLLDAAPGDTVRARFEELGEVVLRF